MCPIFKRSCNILLAFVLCATVLAQEHAAMLTGMGNVAVNGQPAPQGSLAILPGTTVTTGATSGATISVPGAHPSTITMGSTTSVLYQTNSVELNSGSVMVDSNEGTAIHFAGFTVTGEGSSQCRAVASPPRNIVALKGSCKVTDGKQTVVLQEGQAMVPESELAASAKTTGHPVPAAKRGIGDWVIVAAAVIAGGTTLGILLTRGHHHPSPSAP